MLPTHDERAQLSDSRSLTSIALGTAQDLLPGSLRIYARRAETQSQRDAAPPTRSLQPALRIRQNAGSLLRIGLPDRSWPSPQPGKIGAT